MNDKTLNIHWSFWLISVIALLWHLPGIVGVLAQMNADMLASMPESHRAIIESRPGWASAACTLAITCGILGCLALLFKKSFAFYLFIASLFGIIVQVLAQLSLIGSVIHDPFEILMMVVMPPVVTVFLIGYSKHAMNKGWIR